MSGAEEAAARLVELGVKIACITLGPKGALARRGDELFQVPAPAIQVVDTTGAGDGFVAGLLSRLAPAGELTSAQLRDALAFACSIGSRVCTRLGAVAGLPRLAEL